MKPAQEKQPVQDDHPSRGQPSVQNDRHARAKGLFFIVGPPRSGTTLTQARLSAHRRLFVPPETEFFMKHEPPPGAATDQAARKAWLDCWFASTGWNDQGLDEAAFARHLTQTDWSPAAVFLELLAAHAQRAGKPRLGEKSPHHYRHVARLAAMFPHAKFIWMIRDPRDVVASQLATPWTKGSHRRRARAWADAMRRLDEAKRRLDENRLFPLRFETFLKTPEATLRQLCAFLGEDFEPAMLDPTIGGADRADAAIFSSREEAWKGAAQSALDPSAAGRFKTRLSPRQIWAIERLCQEPMARYGYERATKGVKPMWLALEALGAVNDALDRWRASMVKRLRGAS